MAKIGPYPRARRASRLWYNTIVFPFSSGRKGKRPLARKISSGHTCFFAVRFRSGSKFTNCPSPNSGRNLFGARLNLSPLGDNLPMKFILISLLLAVAVHTSKAGPGYPNPSPPHRPIGHFCAHKLPLVRVADSQ